MPVGTQREQISARGQKPASHMKGQCSQNSTGQGGYTPSSPSQNVLSTSPLQSLPLGLTASCLSKPLPTQPSSHSPCSVLDHLVPTPCNFNQLCITLYYSKSLKFFFLHSRNSLRKGTTASYILAHLLTCMTYNRHLKDSLVPGLGKSPGEEKGYPLSILVWRIPWTAQPTRLQRVRHD